LLVRSRRATSARNANAVANSDTESIAYANTIDGENAWRANAGRVADAIADVSDADEHADAFSESVAIADGPNVRNGHERHEDEPAAGDH
jgi:hypothetical protein